jgi:sulfide:quinone oxidoreductase
LNILIFEYHLGGIIVTKNIVVLGAGFAGQTAALYLQQALGKNHHITMITPWPKFTFIPSLVWVGVDRMEPEKTQFDLEPVYRKLGIDFVLGAATEIHPDEQKVVVQKKNGERAVVAYDFLINATGPHLNFEGTPGLGPDHGTSESICNIHHAKQARDAYLENVARMEKGDKVKLVVGTGHGLATCQGAAFEYISNIHMDLVKRGLRDKADLHWISNEPALGDFGIGGLYAKSNGYVMSADEFGKSIFGEYGIDYQVQSAVQKVEKGRFHWENAQGELGETNYDFAMLIPQFKGVPLKYVDKEGADVTAKMTNPAGFALVDGKYGKKAPEVKASDWPARYQNPLYPNIFAAGIAFAPPGPISKGVTTKNGTAITASPPRTGMASGIMGRIAALNVIDMVEGRDASHHMSMAEMPGACIASMGKSAWNGMAASIIINPVVPDYEKYPKYGRDLDACHMEVGLAGAWLKRLLHGLIKHKMSGGFGWKLIPE